MADVTTVLESVPLFAELDERERAEIAAAMTEHRFAAGDVAVREGMRGAAFFVIESGEAEVSVEGEPRRTLIAGDFFGEIALSTGVRRTATIRAKSDLVCWALGPRDFQAFVERNPKLAPKVSEALETRSA
ncbi:MAG TPA: cyclic nucleotide-binding domain-containing protein [Gaiellaceae bacterium]|nr:cyclic nucleotide-binding domain-containing protein [Gaiellaceae bacterium]